MSPMGICDACDALDLLDFEANSPFFGPRRKLCKPCRDKADNWEPSDADMERVADAALERGGDGMSEAERQRCRDAGRGNQVGR